jgi:hypothetical protein
VTHTSPPTQLGFDFDAPVARWDEPPTEAGEVSLALETKRITGRAASRARTDALFAKLQEIGLRNVDALVLMRTRTVMVSLLGRTLRVNDGYADAPENVLRAIVVFATSRHRATRNAARDVILSHEIDRVPPVRRAETARPGDASVIERLRQAHRELNYHHFGNALSTIQIRLSGKMATRLGHFDPGSRHVKPEIVLSRRHVTRHGWSEALHTLLHEMVHQWQHESGIPDDNGRAFRAKCREVGITPSARRDVTPIYARKARSA